MENDQFTVLLTKMSELTEKVTKVDVKCEGIEKDINAIHKQDERQNELLAIHIKGVQTNTARLEEEKKARINAQKEIGNRVAQLEEAPKFRAMLSKSVIKLAAVLTAVSTIVAIVYKLLPF